MSKSNLYSILDFLTRYRSLVFNLFSKGFPTVLSAFCQPSLLSVFFRTFPFVNQRLPFNCRFPQRQLSLWPLLPNYNIYPKHPRKFDWLELLFPCVSVKGCAPDTRTKFQDIFWQSCHQIIPNQFLGPPFSVGTKMYLSCLGASYYSKNCHHRVINSPYQSTWRALGPQVLLGPCNNSRSKPSYRQKKKRTFSELCEHVSLHS